MRHTHTNTATGPLHLNPTSLYYGVCVCVCVCVCMYVCLYACVHTCLYACVYIHEYVSLLDIRPVLLHVNSCLKINIYTYIEIQQFFELYKSLESKPDKPKWVRIRDWGDRQQVCVCERETVCVCWCVCVYVSV